MKTKIRSIFIALVILTVVQSIQAQAHNRRGVFGDFFAGMTLASMDIEGDNRFKKNKIGLIIGGNVNYKFYHNLQLQSGLHLIKKGSLQHEKTSIKDEEGPTDKTDIKSTVDANYIQMPINLGFEVPIAKDLFLNANAGVFIAYGFKGETKKKGYTVRVDNGKYQDIISVDKPTVKTFSNTKYKRFDYGIGANIGLVYDIYILRIQYDHGLANVATDALETEWKTRNYAVCLGFRF